MARKRERAFAAFGAILFLITSCALTIAVVLSMVQDHNSKKNTNSTNQEAKVDNSQKLTGTKLAGFTPTTTPQTQLQAQDTKEGTGETVKSGDTITADYTGALMSNGVIFDASADHGGPISFPLSGVIAGWSQGIPGMKVGGSRRLLIPANLAYGSQGNSGIPPNSDLVFDVTVTKIGK
jgi:FKBP-type peptidyl-prolyl cis-trans isomerase FkpA